jgi:hypothetical protein
MPQLDSIRTANLVRLATARFNATLTDGELKVLRESAASVAPPEPIVGALRPEVRSEFVRWSQGFASVGRVIARQARL